MPGADHPPAPTLADTWSQRTVPPSASSADPFASGRSPTPGEGFAREPAVGASRGRNMSFSLGVPLKLTGELSASCTRATGRNLLAVGGAVEQVAGMLTGAALGAIAVGRHQPSGSRDTVVSVADFEVDIGLSDRIDQLVAGSRGWVQVVRGMSIVDRLSHLSAEISERESLRGAMEPLPHLVVMVGLGNASILRRGYDDASGPAIDFQLVIQRGPAVGVHVLSLADSWRAVTRVLDADAVEEFVFRAALGLSRAATEDVLDTPGITPPPSGRGLLRDERGDLQAFVPYSPLDEPAALLGLIL